ncbi:unnamed protein product [Anisakis simplex]|uniref:VIT domain-containing protein n=1 Tax=Anisakis simplex TaxID=6269 RepID=A0A0M3JGZ1_ANISI|nr:unnamed protein product [Anisakis simplex]
MAEKACSSLFANKETDQNPVLSGFTESLATVGYREELLEFCVPIQIAHNYEDDVTITFKLEYCLRGTFS